MLVDNAGLDAYAIKNVLYPTPPPIQTQELDATISFVGDFNSVFVPGTVIYITFQAMFSSDEVAQGGEGANLIDIYDAPSNPSFFAHYMAGIAPRYAINAWDFNSLDGGTNVPQTFVAATWYDIGLKIGIEPGVGVVITPRIAGVEYATFTSSKTNIQSFDFGGFSPPLITHRNLDNLLIGTTGYGSSDIFSADFTSTIVPPFDATSGANISISSGTLLINDSTGTANFARKNITWP
jgi:hypothetical protein